MEKMKAAVSPPIWRLTWRAAKTLFFVFAMVTSLLLFCAPPLLVAILDIVLPTVLLNAYATVPVSVTTVVANLSSFDFKTSLVDVPLVSILRSLAILCVYSLCDVPGRSRGPYLAATMLCSSTSAAYVTAKAFVMFDGRLNWWIQTADVLGVKVVMLSSMLLAVAHLVVAYKTSCRERRKLIVYRIDLEAVPLSKTGFNHRK